MHPVHLARQALSAIGATTILLLAGCGGVTTTPIAPPAGASEEAPLSSTPSENPPQAGKEAQPEQKPTNPDPTVAGFYSQDARTEIAEVDSFIDALRNGRTEPLLDQYRAVELPCVKRVGLGAPVCPGDKPTGTIVKAYPFAWCGVAFLTDQRELKQYVESAFRGGRYLFAVYRTDHAPGLDNVAAAYAVVLGGGLGDHSAPTVYLDKDGYLVLVRWGCGTPDMAVPAGADLVPLLDSGTMK